MNGRSQAVRLPKAYRFEGKEVYIKRVPEGVLLIPQDHSLWDVWEENLNKYDTPFMTERNQLDVQQERDGLDNSLIDVSDVELGGVTAVSTSITDG